MADSAVPITSGTGTNIDTRTESTNGNHRQVVTIGDPATNAGVAPVDATAGLKVDLGADNDVTVTGTVTAELSATDNAVLDNIDADLTTIIGHVDGAEGLLTTIDADTSNISTKIDTIAGDTTSIQTAVELLDDTVATDGSATPTKGILMAGQDGTNAQTVKTDSDGNLQVDVLTMPSVAVTNAGITTIAGAVSGTEMQVDVITMPTTTVQATNLDIRDLAAASDSVTIHGDVGAIDQLDLTNSNPVTVALVDGDGTHITSIGGGTQYTEGDTDATITGTAMMFESNTGTSAVSVVSSSNPLPISDAGGAITVDGTVAVTNAALTELAAAINSDKVDVNIVSSSVATGGTSAADDADFTDGTTSGTPAMGVYESTPSTVTDGDLGIVGITQDRQLKVSATGTVTANLSATDNAVLDNIDADLTTVIGHVDGIETLIGTTNTTLTTIDGRVDGIEGLLTTIDADTGNIKTNTDFGAVVGGGTETTALRVTIANNSTGVLSVDDNGSTISIDDGGGVITVDGTVAVTNSDITSVKTATELLDDTVFVDDADWTADTSKHLLVGGVTQVATTANTDGDVTPLTTNAFRELRTAIPESDLATAGTSHVKKYYTNAGAVTDGIVWSPAAGKRWYVTDLIINVSAACTVTLEDDKAGGDEAVMKFELAANSGVSHNFTTPWYSGEDAADLIITTTAGNVYVTVCGYEL